MNMPSAEEHHPTKQKFPSVKYLVTDAHKQHASDVHIRVGEKPRFRIRGQITTMDHYPVITSEVYQAYLAEVLTMGQRKRFAQTKEMDAAVFYPGLVRCRINCFDSLNGGAIVLRLISLKIPTIDELRLAPVLKELMLRPQGLLLVTGPTGSGKSTTMAAMLEYLNTQEHKHVVTIEDPIEFVHDSRKCLISQREVGLHTFEFHQALRSVLREDPDVIVVGEMRDTITVNTAIQAAQTGHLVLGSLHTRSALDTLGRLLNLYPGNEQEVMRIQIAEALLAVVSQVLIPSTDDGRVAAQEILVNTNTMKDYLSKNKMEEAYRLLQDDQYNGMQLMNQDIYNHYANGQITIENAMRFSPEPSELERQIRTGVANASEASREWMMEG